MKSRFRVFAKSPLDVATNRVSVIMEPVTGDGESGNLATGRIELAVSDPGSFDFFESGGVYDVELTKVDSSAAPSPEAPVAPDVTIP